LSIVLIFLSTNAARLDRFINRQVTVAGFVAAYRLAETDDGKVMGIMTLEDSSGLAEVTFFPKQRRKKAP
jgi:DNA polymerase III alpha subunit